MNRLDDAKSGDMAKRLAPFCMSLCCGQLVAANNGHEVTDRGRAA